MSPVTEAHVGRVALLYHPKVPASRDMAGDLVACLARQGIAGTAVSAWDEPAVLEVLDDRVELVVTLGGDGTILRAVRLAAAHGVPVLGVNFGRLGYLAELEPADALEQVPLVAGGSLTIEERLMLSCTVRSTTLESGPHHVVNDVFVGRGRAARAARIGVEVDGVALKAFAADGVLVATPTGSTAYNLSAGGPVVYPCLTVMLLTPVVPHPTLVPPLVLPADARIEVTVRTDDEATLSLDGQTHLRLGDGDGVRVEASPYRARFVRVGGRRENLTRLISRLES